MKYSKATWKKKQKLLTMLKQLLAKLARIGEWLEQFSTRT